MSETKPDYVAILERMRACEYALHWLKTQPDARTAYYACTNASWLWWLYNKLGLVTPKQSVKFACACCRHIWPLLTDKRSRDAVKLAERSLHEKVSIEQLQAARDAANAAINAADAFDYDVYAAAHAALYTTNTACAAADAGAATIATIRTRAATSAAAVAYASASADRSMAQPQANRARRAVKFLDVVQAMEKPV